MLLRSAKTRILRIPRNSLNDDTRRLNSIILKLHPSYFDTKSKLLLECNKMMAAKIHLDSENPRWPPFFDQKMQIVFKTLSTVLLVMDQNYQL